MKKTSIKSLRRGDLFCINATQPNGLKGAILLKRGPWAGKIRFRDEDSIRSDMYIALNPFTNVKELLISSSSEIWKV